jgi:hypothetical protein
MARCTTTQQWKGILMRQSIAQLQVVRAKQALDMLAQAIEADMVDDPYEPPEDSRVTEIRVSIPLGGWAGQRGVGVSFKFR